VDRIIDAKNTAQALLQADAYLDAQPTERNVVSIERAQDAHSGAAVGKAR
jgi:hypothetical protein